MRQTITHILNFAKIEHTAFSLPLIFTGAWMGAGNRFPSLVILLLIVLATVGARIFGMAMNRVLDRHIDRLNPRTANRELPTGKITLNAAIAIAGSGLLAYLIACWALGGWCITLSPIPLVPLLVYSLLKRFTSLCHFGIGLCMAIAPLGAFVAGSGHINFSIAVLFFSGFVFFWLSGADIVYAVMDVDHDRKNDIHSLPVRLGIKGAMRVAAGVHLLAWVLLVAVVQIMGGGGYISWLALLISAAFLALMYVPSIPYDKRFFPISTIAGIAGALAPMFA